MISIYYINYTRPYLIVFSLLRRYITRIILCHIVSFVFKYLVIWHLSYDVLLWLFSLDKCLFFMIENSRFRLFCLWLKIQGLDYFSECDSLFGWGLLRYSFEFCIEKWNMKTLWGSLFFVIYSVVYLSCICTKCCT